MGADTAGVSRAQPSETEGIQGISLYFPERAVLYVGDSSALPEADVTKGRDLLNTEHEGILLANQRIGCGHAAVGEMRISPLPVVPALHP